MAGFRTSTQAPKRRGEPMDESCVCGGTEDPEECDITVDSSTSYPVLFSEAHICCQAFTSGRRRKSRSNRKKINHVQGKDSRSIWSYEHVY